MGSGKSTPPTNSYYTTNEEVGIVYKKIRVTEIEDMDICEIQEELKENEKKLNKMKKTVLKYEYLKFKNY